MMEMYDLEVLKEITYIGENLTIVLSLQYRMKPKLHFTATGKHYTQEITKVTHQHSHEGLMGKNWSMLNEASCRN